MNRVDELREILEKGEYFKLVCGAGNEDCEEIRRLSVIYTLAGANAFDISANVDAVVACNEGISKAYELADDFGIEIKTRPFINVSVGLPGDHHVRKASLDLSKCIKCMRCGKVCPTNAINQELVINPQKCIGCGHCEAICPSKNEPISFKHNAKAIADIIPKCFEVGAETVELHAAIGDNENIFNEWRQVKELNPNHFISMCLDRANLSNSNLIERVKGACEIGGDLTIIQADGVPMSGGSDDFQTTLQAVAIAEVLQKEFCEKNKNKKGADYKFYLLLSGGTNGQTAELAHLCNIKYHGLSLGTHARKIVKKYVISEDYCDTKNYLLEPLKIAKDLVTKRVQVLEKYGQPVY